MSHRLPVISARSGATFLTTCIKKCALNLIIWWAVVHWAVSFPRRTGISNSSVNQTAFLECKRCKGSYLSWLTPEYHSNPHWWMWRSVWTSRMFTTLFGRKLSNCRAFGIASVPVRDARRRSHQGLRKLSSAAVNDSETMESWRPRGNVWKHCTDKPTYSSAIQAYSFKLFMSVFAIRVVVSLRNSAARVWVLFFIVEWGPLSFCSLFVMFY